MEEVGSMYRSSSTWQKAMQLTKNVYQVTKSFPADERFGLTNQIRRAAVSVPSNIAEGKGRVSDAEMMRFLGIARGSVLEVQTQLDIAAMLQYGEPDQLNQTQLLAQEVVKMLNASLRTMRGNNG